MMRYWLVFARVGAFIVALIYVTFMSRIINMPFVSHREKTATTKDVYRDEAIGITGNTSTFNDFNDTGLGVSKKPLSTILEDFAMNLGPSAKMKTRIRTVITKIQNTIYKHMKHKYSIDRIIPLGSYSKKTSIWFTMDLDVTVYLNDQHPPFKDFLEHLEEVIAKYLDNTCKGNRHLVKAKLDDLNVDIIPATNFVKRQFSNHGNTSFIQVYNALKFLKDKHSDYANYSTALTPGAVEFEKRRSYYSRSLSRLAKVWSTVIGVHGFHYGRSCLMEYLGVYAAELEPSRDILKGFRRFLELIIHLDDLNVIWTTFYRRNDIPPSILKQRPILLDPTNPRNNFLFGRTRSHVKKMAPFAITTLNRIEEAEKNTSKALMKIFEPQPRLSILYDSKHKIPCDFLVGAKRSTDYLPRVEIRRGAEGVNPSILEGYLFVFVNVVAASIKVDFDDHNGGGSSPITTDDTRAAECLISLMARRVVEEVNRLLGKCPGDWLSTPRHEDRQITFNMPVAQDSNEYIIVSFDWV